MRERRSLHVGDEAPERRRLLAAHVAGEHPEVDPGREDGAFSVHDDRADVGLALRLGDGVDQREEQIAMDRVPLLGTVERDVTDGAFATALDEVGHAAGDYARAVWSSQSFTL
jgi:hypothetical protein